MKIYDHNLFIESFGEKKIEEIEPFQKIARKLSCIKDMIFIICANFLDIRN